jgi:hypothetical protein
MGTVRTYRSGFGRGLTVGMALVAVVALASTARTQGTGAVLSTGAPPLAAAVGVWALFWRPALEVSDDGLTVINVLRTTHVPWPCVTGVDVTWSLRVLTTRGPLTVWAVPVRGVLAARAAHRRGGEGAGVRPTAGADAPAVAGEITARLDTLRETGVGTPTRDAVGPTERWHVGTIAVLGVLVTWVWLGALAP